MYIQEFYSEDLREEVYQALKYLGIKSTLKKLNSKSNLLASSKKVFNTPLSSLDRQQVLLRHSGALVYIPSFVVNACNHLRTDLAVEGIFRKAGSASRQREIKARLDNGGGLNPDDHVIDVANILKYFFRELPEPLIPYGLHETLTRCLWSRGKETETVLLSCLLLSPENMDCLTYLIEFLNEVISLKDFNKMSATNIAIVFAPNILPIKTKSSQVVINQNSSNHQKIVKILLENACLLGAVPDSISERLPLNVQSGHSRRNSGSLTRIVSGLKRMVGKVGSSTSDVHLNTRSNTIATPSSSNPVVPILSAKKRKVHDAPTPFSMKKRREVLRCLPEESILPKSPMVSKCFSSRLAIAEYRNGSSDTPDSNLVLGNCGSSSQSRNNPEVCDGSSQYSGKVRTRTPSSGSHSGLRRLSNFSRKKLKAAKLMKSSSFPALVPNSQPENDLMTTPRRLAMSQDSCYAQFLEEDFVRVPKKEYEEIKSRVSEIESRISQEFSSMGVLLSDSDGSQEDLRATSKVDEVQSQYQKTLRDTERLSDVCTDAIAQHLSRELKIRHSAGGRVMRSPSQRKIGSIRRRSQERIPRRELSRHGSLNLPRTKNPYLYRSHSLQRGRPNSFSSAHNSARLTRSVSDKSRKKPVVIKNKPQPIILKSASVVKSNSVVSSQPSSSVTVNSSHVSLDPAEAWTSAQSFLASNSLEKKSYLLNGDRRESVKQIRVQNAGMVMEKAKMFSSIADRTVVGPPPRRAQSTGNFVTSIKLNGVNTTPRASLNIGMKETSSKTGGLAYFPGKENLDTNAKEVLVSPSVYKTPVSSFLHRNHRPANSPKSPGKKHQFNRQVLRTQSERTPHKTVITIGTPRRSPRLNELKN